MRPNKCINVVLERKIKGKKLEGMMSKFSNFVKKYEFRSGSSANKTHETEKKKKEPRKTIFLYLSHFCIFFLANML